MTMEDPQIVKAAEGNCVNYMAFFNDVCDFEKEALAVQNACQLGAIVHLSIVMHHYEANKHRAKRIM